MEENLKESYYWLGVIDALSHPSKDIENSIEVSNNKCHVSALKCSYFITVTAGWYMATIFNF